MNPLVPSLKAELGRIARAGATYADVRYVPSEEEESLSFVQGNLKNVSRSTTAGIGVRVLTGGAWGFAAASSLDALTAVFDCALENARAASRRVAFPIQLAPRTPVTASYESPCKTDPFTVPLADKIGLLERVDKELGKPGVAQRFSHIGWVRKHIIFLDSDGAHVEKTIHDIFGGMSIVGVEKNGMSQHRSFELRNKGVGTRGWESFLEPAFYEAQAGRLVSELNQVLEAPQCPKDTRSAILLPGIMFLQTHEVIGHALELDRILGYELSYAGGSFVKLSDFGTLRYGSDKLTVRANATVPNAPGSFGFDDDGTPCQNYVLIENGILKSALSSRTTILEANAKAGRTIFTASGGCARASGFNRIPLERMTNVNIEAGTDGTLDDIIAATEHGIVMDGAQSWSIGSNREQFHFACEIGWLVEDGRKTGVVKNPTCGMDTLPFWRGLSAVGDETTRELVFCSNCGKGLPSQSMNVGHQVPVCRFDNVIVGR